MGLFDIFKKQQPAPQGDPKVPRKHHYTFAYKALPGLAFADPHVPLSLASVTYSWKDLQELLSSGDPFDKTPNRKLANLWAYAGAQLPSRERLSDSGLSAIGGEFGTEHVLMLVRLPEPLRDTEAHFVMLVYPKGWFEDTKVYEQAAPNLGCYLLARSGVPGASGSGATLRVIKREGHGSVNFGVDPTAQSFLQEVRLALSSPEQWITWVDSPTWNFFMRDVEKGETHGSA